MAGGLVHPSPDQAASNGAPVVHWCFGVRPIERGLEGRDDNEAEVIRGYCAAVRSSITDDGRPPLEASGLKLHRRLTTISESLDRVAEKRGSRKNSIA